MFWIADQIAQAAQSVLEPGEFVEVATVAGRGDTDIGMTAVVAVAQLFANEGSAIIWPFGKKEPVVLTTNRLLVLGRRGLFRGYAESRIVAATPRSELRATVGETRLSLKLASLVAVLTYWTPLYLTDLAGHYLGELQFARGNLKEARRIAEALGSPPARPA